MAENTNTSSWGDDITSILNNAINAVTVITGSKYQAQAAKESARVQDSINQSTAQSAAQQAQSNNMVRNILLVLGGSLGLILAYGLAKKALK